MRNPLWVTAALAVVVIVSFITRGFYANPPQESVNQKQKTDMENVIIKSDAFENNTAMPARFTCDGDNVSPPLEIGSIPANAKSLALIMHDPDAPVPGGWTHWVKWNMPWNMEEKTWSTEEGKEPQGIGGKGSGGSLTYQGPCPPAIASSSGKWRAGPPSGTHRYFFKIYALDTELALAPKATKTELESAMKGRIVGEGTLIGLYARRK